ncbi:hypothetical protein, partial [Microbacterium sp. BF1]|uniref:hypothetical protein n=1 Tax=Microbacterium sp. BF1 TaxID=2821146 RepID=UPI002119EBD7
MHANRELEGEYTAADTLKNVVLALMNAARPPSSRSSAYFRTVGSSSDPTPSATVRPCCPSASSVTTN